MLVLGLAMLLPACSPAGKEAERGNETAAASDPDAPSVAVVAPSQPGATPAVAILPPKPGLPAVAVVPPAQRPRSRSSRRIPMRHRLPSSRPRRGSSRCHSDCG